MIGVGCVRDAGSSADSGKIEITGGGAAVGAVRPRGSSAPGKSLGGMSGAGGGVGTRDEGVPGVNERGRCESPRRSGGGEEIDDSLKILRGCGCDHDGRRRGGDVEDGGAKLLARGGIEALGGCDGEAIDGRAGSPRQRIAPCWTSRSRISWTCSAGRPVMATMSEEFELPSTRERTKPSMAVSGSVRMSTPPLSSGTRRSRPAN